MGVSRKMSGAYRNSYMHIHRISHCGLGFRDLAWEVLTFEYLQHVLRATLAAATGIWLFSMWTFSLAPCKEHVLAQLKPWSGHSWFRLELGGGRGARLDATHSRLAKHRPVLKAIREHPCLEVQLVDNSSDLWPMPASLSSTREVSKRIVVSVLSDV